MTRCGWAHPLEKTDSICCPNAYVEELTQFIAPMTALEIHLGSRQLPRVAEANSVFIVITSAKILQRW